MKWHRLLIGLCVVGATAPWVSALTSSSTNVTLIDSLLDVGCGVGVVAPDPIKITRDLDSPDPRHTYTGCGQLTVISSYQLQLSASATGTSDAGGKWETTIRPSAVARGTTQIGICVTGKELAVGLVAAGTTVKVAKITITVMPLL